MALSSLPAQVIASARLGRIWPLLAVKQALNSSLPVAKAFACYKQALELDNHVELEFRKIVPLRDAALSQGLVYRETSAAGTPFINSPPEVIGDGDHRALEGLSRSMYVAAFADAQLQGRSAFIELDGQILLDYEGNERARIDDELELDPAIFRADTHGAWTIGAGARTPVLQLEEAFSLLGPNTYAFGHWLGEYLPKFLAADLSGVLPNVPLLIDAGMPHQHRQALEAMIPAGAEIIEVNMLQRVHVRRLWCGSTHFYAPVLPRMNERFKSEYIAIPPQGFSVIVAEMKRRIGDRTSVAAEKVFLARKPSGHRNLDNYLEIEAVARFEGFTIFHPEEHDFAEQLQAVANAKYIMGPEGSAFYLALLSKPGTNICILNHPHTALLPRLTALFDEIGLDCRVITGPYTRKDPDYLHFSDFTIDEPAFRQFVRQWQ